MRQTLVKLEIDEIALNPLPHTPILGSSNAAVNKDMVGDAVI